MSRLANCGSNIKMTREAQKLSVADLARMAVCKEELLAAIEENKLHTEPHGMLALLDRIAEALNVPVDQLLLSPSSSTVASARLCEMIVYAIETIFHNQLTDSIDVVRCVVEQIRFEFNDAVLSTSHSNRRHRWSEKAFSIDEDRVRDLVLRANRELGNGGSLWRQ